MNSFEIKIETREKCFFNSSVGTNHDINDLLRSIKIDIFLLILQILIKLKHKFKYQ